MDNSTKTGWSPPSSVIGHGDAPRDLPPSSREPVRPIGKAYGPVRLAVEPAADLARRGLLPSEDDAVDGRQC
jgi:hypothetical protein